MITIPHTRNTQRRILQNPGCCWFDHTSVHGIGRVMNELARNNPSPTWESFALVGFIWLPAFTRVWLSSFLSKVCSIKTIHSPMGELHNENNCALNKNCKCYNCKTHCTVSQICLKFANAWSLPAQVFLPFHTRREKTLQTAPIIVMTTTQPKWRPEMLSCFPPSYLWRRPLAATLHNYYESDSKVINKVELVWNYDAHAELPLHTM